MSDPPATTSALPLVDDDGVVRIGSVVFALIRPAPGHDLAFNHWYERDHFYTCGIAAPGVFSAARFVEPHEHRHLALYFVLPGFEPARIAFAVEQATRANAEGRGFTEREHLHTWRYEPVRTWRADPRGVPPALALDHRYPHLTAVLCEGNAASVVRALRSEPDVDVVLLLAAVEQVMPSAWGPPEGTTDRTAVLAFHRTPLVDGTETVSGLPDVQWAGSFVPTVVGTDTHVE